MPIHTCVLVEDQYKLICIRIRGADSLTERLRCKVATTAPMSVYLRLRDYSCQVVTVVATRPGVEGMQTLGLDYNYRSGL